MRTPQRLVAALAAVIMLATTCVALAADLGAWDAYDQSRTAVHAPYTRAVDRFSNWEAYDTAHSAPHAPYTPNIDGSGRAKQYWGDYEEAMTPYAPYEAGPVAH
jgi:hypothetical protein